MLGFLPFYSNVYLFHIQTTLMNTMWWTCFVILLGSILALLYKYSNRNYDYWKKRNVLFIKPYPFFGSILPLFAMKTTIGEWLWDFCGKIKDDYFGIFVFNRPVLIVNSPKLIKAIIQKDFTYFDDRSAVTNTDDPIMAEFMFFKKNPEWKPVRAKISPIFTSGKLKVMFPLVLEESNKMLEYLKKFANIPNIEAKEVAAKYSTNVISKCAFAVDAGSFNDENAEFRNITRQMFGFRLDTALRQFGAWFTPGLVKLFSVQFFHSEVVNACKRIFLEVLSLKKQSGNLKGHDLIDMMLDTNNKHGEQYFTDDAMVGHAIQFFAAGFETASSAISFALYELAVHPEIQEKLRYEVMDTIEKGDITYSAIQDMKYLDMVVCETLRKYPVLPFLDRMCNADYKVEGTDLIIEKGTAVYIPMFGLHYNPKYFPDPHKYDPERFADKSKINNEEMYYIPFGEGPRICIGERFGLLVVKIGIAQIISKFRMERSPKTPDPIEYEPKSLVLQSKVGIPLTFVPL